MDSAFVTTGMDGRTYVWDLNTFALLQPIKALEKSIIPDTIAYCRNTLIFRDKDGRGVENTCDAF